MHWTGEFLFYDIDEETGTRQFSFYAIWLFSACAVSMVTLPPYIYYLCRRSTIQATAVNNIKYTLLDFNDATSERTPADWRTAKAICFGDSLISSRSGYRKVKNFSNSPPNKTDANCLKEKQSAANEVSTVDASRKPIGTALEIAKRISEALQNCPREMPVDSVASESARSSDSSAGNETSPMGGATKSRLRVEAVSKTGDAGSPDSCSESRVSK